MLKFKAFSSVEKNNFYWIKHKKKPLKYSFDLEPKENNLHNIAQNFQISINI